VTAISRHRGSPARHLRPGAVRPGRHPPAAVGAAYWFTSSTSFAHPAIIIGRVFSDTFAGIAPVSVAPFVLAQLAGAAVALALIRVLY
jgi:hypothetical protein